MTETNSEVSFELFVALKKDPLYSKLIDEIISRESHSIDPEFLGFVKTYKLLSDLIPKDRTIYDLGCASAIQSYYFRDHHKYVGVDLLSKPNERLITPNSIHYKMSISEFFGNHPIDICHFAICNYVPPWHNDNEELVRQNTRHLFVFYPLKRDDTKLVV